MSCVAAFRAEYQISEVRRRGRGGTRGPPELRSSYSRILLRRAGQDGATIYEAPNY
jgi:hypothetical protein